MPAGSGTTKFRLFKRREPEPLRLLDPWIYYCKMMAAAIEQKTGIQGMVDILYQDWETLHIQYRTTEWPCRHVAIAIPVSTWRHMDQRIMQEKIKATMMSVIQEVVSVVTGV